MSIAPVLVYCTSIAPLVVLDCFFLLTFVPSEFVLLVVGCGDQDTVQSDAAMQEKVVQMESTYAIDTAAF